MITSFHPHQQEEELKDFISKSGEDWFVLSCKPLPFPHKVVSQEPISPPDDSLRCLLVYLIDAKDEVYTFVDWESIYRSADLKEELKKLKKTTQGIEIVEENVRVQDFRFAPFMENLLHICGQLNLPGTDRLFAENPNFLYPKIIRGTKSDLMDALKTFIDLRRQIKSPKFNGVVPIFNSEFIVKL